MSLLSRGDCNLICDFYFCFGKRVLLPTIAHNEKPPNVFCSSDDQLEDSDSDEHSRSESLTGMNSWVRS